MGIHDYRKVNGDCHGKRANVNRRYSCAMNYSQNINRDKEAPRNQTTQQVVIKGNQTAIISIMTNKGAVN